ncbi:MAG: terminase small subunit [Ruminococcus sp.]|nr:terminase small subunit [Ruminococcus sp.]
MSEKDELKQKRKRFCYMYAVLGDPESAALQAGFARGEALGAALECLKSPVCRRHIAELRELLGDSGSVLAGLRRLAFGSCNDAVRLAFSDELPPQNVLDTLDLYNVSEIKRVRGGGVEVKVFDRIKALEKLCELERTLSDSGTAEALIKALTSHGEEDGSNGG